MEKSEKYFVTIQNPETYGNIPPSSRFRVIGYLSLFEAKELEQELNGFLSRVVLFGSESEFEREMDRMDSLYWDEREGMLSEVTEDPVNVTMKPRKKRRKRQS